MSLDVQLKTKEKEKGKEAPRNAIFVRHAGSIKEITQDEWNKLYPTREPYGMETEEDDDAVFSYNITHNLTKMANAAGIYQHLWRPEEIGITKAEQLIEPLKKGLEALKGNPDHFKQYNPTNGWGTYQDLVDFVCAYLDACRKYPDAYVTAYA